MADSGSSDVNPSNDVKWNTFVELKIVAHPGLGEYQKSVIERDFGMEQGILVMKTRVALAFYLITRLNLDLDVAPERMQIFLSNRAEIQEAERTAKNETRTRVSVKA